jgi:hypothetical protein
MWVKEASATMMRNLKIPSSVAMVKAERPTQSKHALGMFLGNRNLSAVALGTLIQMNRKAGAKNRATTKPTDSLSNGAMDGESDAIKKHIPMKRKQTIATGQSGSGSGRMADE